MTKHDGTEYKNLVIMLSVIQQSVVMLNVVAPSSTRNVKHFFVVNLSVP